MVSLQTGKKNGGAQGGKTIDTNRAVDDLVKVKDFLANSNGEDTFAPSGKQEPKIRVTKGDKGDAVDGETAVDGAEEETPEENVEPSAPPQYTLEEYEAQKAAAAAAVQQETKVRAVKPIDDLKQRKRDDDTVFIKLAQGVEKNTAKKDQRSTTKVAAEIGFQVGPVVDPERDSPREERGSRGGRGGRGPREGRGDGRGRGSEGRGNKGGRSPRPSAGAGAKFDPSDFPSL